MLRAITPAWLLLGTLGALAACSATDGSPPGDDDNPQGGSVHSGGQFAGNAGSGTSGKGGSAGSSSGGSNGGGASGSGGGSGTGGTAAAPTGGSLNGGNSGAGGSVAGRRGSGGSGGSSGGGVGGSQAGSSAGGSSGSQSGGAGGAAGSGGSAGTTGGRPPGELEFVGNITTHNSVDTDGKTFSRHWDQITPENAGKWGSVQSNVGAGYNWSTLDAIYDYTQRNGLQFKQHTFIWGPQQPGGNISEANVKAWMSAFCQRYPNTTLIDVVNEPPPHTTPTYANAIGGGTDGSWQWIINAFNWAHEACPNAILILNDYNNIEWSGDNDHIIDIVKKLQAAGAPIDAIGAQAHDLDHAQVSFDTVRTLLSRLHTETNLPIYITEMDISSTDDTEQLEYYQQYFPLFRDSGYVKGLTIWGWIYGKTWSLSPNSGLVRNGSARPAMTYLMEQLGRPNP